MKINHRPGKAAFTLIELMAVITIIVILAGLVVGGLGYVTDKQAKSKASVQIALISKALEEYKLDMGSYPPTANKTSSTAPAGTSTSSILFKALYWDSDNDGIGATKPPSGNPPNADVLDEDQKLYLAELNPYTSKQGWTTTTPAVSAGTKITDPWGNEYCYRTALGIPPVPPATGSTPVNAATQNPDFDLWSMGKDGKSTATPADKSNLDDIKNF